MDEFRRIKKYLWREAIIHFPIIGSIMIIAIIVLAIIVLSI